MEVSQIGDVGDDENIDNEKKKFKKVLDANFIYSFDVFQDIPQETLKILDKLEKKINVKLSFEQDKLENIEANINSITEFKKKVIKIILIKLIYFFYLLSILITKKKGKNMKNV